MLLCALAGLPLKGFIEILTFEVAEYDCHAVKTTNIKGIGDKL